MERDRLLFQGACGNMDKVNRNKTPNLYGALVLYFSKETSRIQIADVLHEYTDYQMFEDTVEIVYREIKTFYSWDVDDLLTELFNLCDFEAIKAAQEQLGAKVLLDVSFIHYDSYPALLFSGKNMNQIHMIQADISIDPY